MSTQNLAQLKQALAVAEQIHKLEVELASVLAGAAPSAPVKAAAATAKPAQKGKRTMSPEARARIAAAQKARWAKLKKAIS